MQVKTFDKITRVKVPEPAEYTPVNPVQNNPDPTAGGTIIVPLPTPPATTEPGGPTGDATPVYNLALGTKLVTGLKPVQQFELNPASPNVLQCAIKVTSNLIFSMQATTGSNGSREPYETTVLSRMRGDGTLIDSMTLVNGGHGLSFVVENINGVYWIWHTWLEPVSGGTKNDLVRFPYKAGTYKRSQVPSLSTMTQFGDAYYSADWDSDWLVAHAGSSNTLRKISEFKAGINKTYGFIKADPGGTNQGFCTVNGTLFIYQGAQNGESKSPPDPCVLHQYSWATGKLVASLKLPDMGKRGDTGQFRDGVKEPESSTMYRDPATGLATLIMGVTTGKAGNHRWPMYSLVNIGDKADLNSVYIDPSKGTPVQPTPTPDPVTGSSVFTIGVTKPDSSNVGLLAGSTKGSLDVVNGNMTVTVDNTVIKNKYVKGRILVRAKNVKIINCWVGGGAVPTGTNTAMIDCNSSAANATQVVNCVLCPDTPNLWVNGIIGHDYTIRYCNIYNVVDGCGVYQNGDLNTIIEANYIHDLAYFTNDPNHSDGHTHNDGIQNQGGSDVVIRGNNIQAFANPNIGNYSSNPYRPAVTGQAIAGTPNVAKITGMVIDKNWLDGGANTITVVLNKFAKSNIGSITDNRFGHNANSNRSIVVDPTHTVSLSGNVYEDTGKAVKVYRQAA